jgi:transposase-like protein
MHSFWDCKRIKCGRCGKYFTALTGTFLSGCHFNFREIVLLALLLALGVVDKQIAAILKISSENVRLWRHHFGDLGQVKKIMSGGCDGN